VGTEEARSPGHHGARHVSGGCYASPARSRGR
jgi:hypothetical protein